MEDWVSDVGANLDEVGQGKLRDVLNRCLRVRLPILRAAGVF
jgi:hypothetical protein